MSKSEFKSKSRDGINPRNRFKVGFTKSDEPTVEFSEEESRPSKVARYSSSVDPSAGSSSLFLSDDDGDDGEVSAADLGSSHVGPSILLRTSLYLGY